MERSEVQINTAKNREAHNDGLSLQIFCKMFLLVFSSITSARSKILWLRFSSKWRYCANEKSQDNVWSRLWKDYRKTKQSLLWSKRSGTSVKASNRLGTKNPNLFIEIQVKNWEENLEETFTMARKIIYNVK